MLKKKRLAISFHSLRFKLICGLIALMLPLCVYLMYNNIYATNILREQVAKTNRTLISLYMQEADSHLSSVSLVLADMISNNSDLQDMQYQSDQSNRNLAKARVFNTFSNDITQYSYLGSLFAYSTYNSEFVSVSKYNDNYALEQKMKQYICNYIEKAEMTGSVIPPNYFTQRINGCYYFFRILKRDHLYIGILISADDLQLPVKLINSNDNAVSLFVTDSGIPMDNADFIRSNRISLSSDSGNDSSGYYISGQKNKFLVVGQKSTQGNFRLIALIPDRLVLGNLAYLHSIAEGIVIFAFLLIPFYILFILKEIVFPFNRITSTMRKVNDGDISARIDGLNGSDEFLTVADTFNNMMDEIGELKISVYEEKISKQKEEMQNLRLQINPHFFMNALHIIYSLAQMKDYKLVQEMSLCLFKYFSFVSRKKADLIKLDEELEQLRNYIRIQELRFIDCFTYTLNVDERLLDKLVPPMTLQTFVENTFKYALDMDEKLHFSIDITSEPDEKTMKLVFQNTGAPFENELLEKLRSGKKIIKTDGEHIGIWNVSRRLELLYSGKSTITFENLLPKGIMVTILLPILP